MNTSENLNKNSDNIKLIYLLSFASGFLSLSLEVIWVRIISFSVFSVPQAFSYTLAIFLVGISIGAWFGKRICQNTKRVVDTALIGKYFLIAGVVDLIIMMIAYSFMNMQSDSIRFAYVAAIFILISAAVRGVIFPTVHHVGTMGANQSKSGKQISNVYFANVAGSALSPVLIGFFILDFFSTQQVYVLICALSVLIAVLCQSRLNAKKMGLIGLTGAILLGLLIPEKIFHRLSEHVGLPLKTLVENKHGFIQVYEDKKKNDDVVYGANVYDGRFNTNLFHTTNWIDRAYWLPAMNHKIKNVLVVGLSTGSWVRVLSSIPEVEQITVIEINPDYVKLIEQYEEVAPILRDKRINIVVDDGRKWLRRNPDAKFDLVLMNTTWYWRAYASNLLSQDFLNMVKPHLNEGGVFAYNSTGSKRVYVTAVTVYPYVYEYKNFVYASLKPLDTYNAREQVKQNLARLYWQDKKQPVFADDAQLNAALDVMYKHKFDLRTQKYYGNDDEIITDNNMITEFKYGQGM